MTIGSAAVIGLGKLGMPMAACLAARGLRVVGADMNARTVELVNRREAPVAEPGLQAMMQSAGERLSATTNVVAAVSTSEITFIVVPTPSRKDGGFSVDFVLSACEPVSQALQDLDHHVVVLTSTVLPGASDGTVRTALERGSGKRCGVEFGLCYSPEFIALGSVIRDFLRPDFVLIGESDPRSGDLLADVYRRVCKNDPPVARMSFVNAEIAKLAVNTFVTTKISFANMLAELCERVPGGDVDAVTSALSLDGRIGGSYLKGALSYGGPCFPRDNVALAAFARSVDVLPAIPEATDATNRFHAAHVLRAIRNRVPPGGTVGVLGLSYKPDTDVVERSPGLELALALAEGGIKVVAYDPTAAKRTRVEASNAVDLADSLEECISRSNVIVLATPWEEFRAAVPLELARSGERRTVIDCWRMLDPTALGDQAEYVALGVA